MMKSIFELSVLYPLRDKMYKYIQRLLTQDQSSWYNNYYHHMYNLLPCANCQLWLGDSLQVKHKNMNDGGCDVIIKKHNGNNRYKHIGPVMHKLIRYVIWWVAV